MDLLLNRRSALAGGLATGAMLGTGASAAAEDREATEFYSLIRAEGPHPSLGQHADTFGRLIGDWRGDYRQMPADKPPVFGQMEFHQGWILDGRAVQDVFIFSQPGSAAAGRVSRNTAKTFGSTIRYFDPKMGVWHVRWTDPGNNVAADLVAKRVGDDIVQLGMKDGVANRWVFSDITPRSFIWRNHELQRDGTTWVHREEYHLRRM
jgi:hypothetical protein